MTPEPQQLRVGDLLQHQSGRAMALVLSKPVSREFSTAEFEGTFVEYTIEILMIGQTRSSTTVLQFMGGQIMLQWSCLSRLR
jgi:hypothetical protein